ncbi:MAG: hypothetical protein PHV97_03100 [Candidatus Omnitrophica bacterium]|nr:hypothetical protein [Candidatus Omnitrophota bacterium]
MSIVYDYLKQIHDKKETKTVTPAPVTPPVKKNEGSFFWVKILAGILALLLLGGGLYYFLPKAGKTTVKLYRAPQNTPAVQSAIPDFSFLLEGIIYNPSQPFAIIDGKMYEVGGRTGDYEVVKITPDTVSLKNLKDGTSRTVRL